MKKLIIIPAYNEEDNILRVVKNINIKQGEYDYIVINDCSKDGTAELLKNNRIPFLDLSCNLGIGGAVQAGYRYALKNDYDVAIQMDGDGQHDVSWLDSLVKPIEDGVADICIGSRFIDKKGFQSSFLRRSGISILSNMIKVITGQRIYDVTSGFRAVGRKMIEFYAFDYPQDYPEPEAIVKAYKKGAVIQEIPVEMLERQGGSSSINASKAVYYMIKVAIAILIASIQKEKRT